MAPEIIAAKQIDDILQPLSADQRRTTLLMLSCCLECGCDDPDGKCQCWNDE